MLIQFPVGDWSGDGHGKCEYATVECDGTLQECRKAHFSCKKVTGIDPGEICSEYGENNITKEVFDKLVSLGFKIPEDSEEDEFDTEWLGWKNVLHIWLFLLNKTNPKLNLRYIEPPPIPCIVYGEGRDRKIVDVPGYGCFE